MAYPRFFMKAKGVGRNIGNETTIIIENHGKSGFMAQLTTGPQNDPNDLRSTTLVLDTFKTLIDACDAVSYPHDLVGLPILA